MKSHISGIQIPTPARINIDGGLTLDSLAGTSGHMMISQGTGNTPIWSNTLTSPTIVTSLLTSSTSFDLLNTTATTINFAGAATTLSIGTTTATSVLNFGTGAVTGSKEINIGTAGAAASSTTINVGSNVQTASSTIFLQGQTYFGQSRTGTGTTTGYGAIAQGPTTTVTGTTGNATGGDLLIYSGAAGLTNAGNLAGVATSGNITIDAGSASVAYFDATAAYGSISIGTGNASGVTIGKSTGTTTINSARMKEPLLTSISTIGGGGSEGGQINFARVTDGAQYWYIDSFGATSTPSLRFVENVTTRIQIDTGGTVNLYGGLVGATTTTSLAPLRLPTGTVPTTANQQFGMIAADAESLQLATTKTTGAGPGFGFIRAPQMVYAIANSGAATTTTAVSPFAAASDTLSSLEVNKSYRFRGVYYFTSTFTSGTPTIQLLFAFTNAPVIFKYSFKTYNSSGLGATFSLVGLSSTNGASTVSANITNTSSYVVEFEGFFTSNATTASTLIPQFRMSATGVSTVATSGSFFEIEKLGTSTQTTIAGNWA
jgi:hypothetical protein